MRTPRAFARGVPMGLMTVRCLISKALHLLSLYKVKVSLSVAMATKRSVFLSSSGVLPPPYVPVPSKAHFC